MKANCSRSKGKSLKIKKWKGFKSASAWVGARVALGGRRADGSAALLFRACLLSAHPVCRPPCQSRHLRGKAPGQGRAGQGSCEDKILGKQEKLENQDHGAGPGKCGRGLPMAIVPGLIRTLMA